MLSTQATTLPWILFQIYDVKSGAAWELVGVLPSKAPPPCRHTHGSSVFCSVPFALIFSYILFFIFTLLSCNRHRGKDSNAAQSKIQSRQRSHTRRQLANTSDKEQVKGHAESTEKRSSKQKNLVDMLRKQRATGERGFETQEGWTKAKRSVRPGWVIRCVGTGVAVKTQVILMRAGQTKAGSKMCRQ